jgi:hypothetical protein
MRRACGKQSAKLAGRAANLPEAVVAGAATQINHYAYLFRHPMRVRRWGYVHQVSYYHRTAHVNEGVAVAIWSSTHTTWRPAP